MEFMNKLVILYKDKVSMRAYTDQLLLVLNNALNCITQFFEKFKSEFGLLSTLPENTFIQLSEYRSLAEQFHDLQMQYEKEKQTRIGLESNLARNVQDFESLFIEAQQAKTAIQEQMI